jgi:hypothetical protein
LFEKCFFCFIQERFLLTFILCINYIKNFLKGQDFFVSFVSFSTLLYLLYQKFFEESSSAIFLFSSSTLLVYYIKNFLEYQIFF